MNGSPPDRVSAGQVSLPADRCADRRRGREPMPHDQLDVMARTAEGSCSMHSVQTPSPPWSCKRLAARRVSRQSQDVISQDAPQPAGRWRLLRQSPLQCGQPGHRSCRPFTAGPSRIRPGHQVAARRPDAAAARKALDNGKSAHRQQGSDMNLGRWS